VLIHSIYETSPHVRSLRPVRVLSNQNTRWRLFFSTDKRQEFIVSSYFPNRYHTWGWTIATMLYTCDRMGNEAYPFIIRMFRPKVWAWCFAFIWWNCHAFWLELCLLYGKWVRNVSTTENLGKFILLVMQISPQTPSTIRYIFQLGQLQGPKQRHWRRHWINLFYRSWPRLIKEIN